MLEFRTCFPSEASCHRKSETHLSSTVFPLTNWFSIFHERNKARTNSFLPRCSLSNISILVGLMMFKSINSWSWKSGVNLNLFGNIFWSIPLARPSKIRLTVKPGVGGGIFHSYINEKWRWWTIIDGNKSWLFRNLLQKLDLHLVAKSRFLVFSQPRCKRCPSTHLSNDQASETTLDERILSRRASRFDDETSQTKIPVELLLRLWVHWYLQSGAHGHDETPGGLLAFWKAKESFVAMIRKSRYSRPAHVIFKTGWYMKPSSSGVCLTLSLFLIKVLRLHRPEIVRTDGEPEEKYLAACDR